MTKDGPIFGKFVVTRTDGTSKPGCKHDCCEYFVLDLTHDPYALRAMTAYATAAITGDHPELGLAINKRIREIEQEDTSA